jgi:hypothetical protein
MQGYGALVFPLRLAVGGFVTLVAGTWLGFVAEYAAYRWAIYYGMRPPLEGIPYLKVAVTGLSVSILFGGAIVYVLVRLAANTLLQYVERAPGAFGDFGQAVVDAFLEFYRNFSVGAVLAISFTVACLVGIGVYITQYIERNDFPVLTDAIGVALLSFFSMLLLWNRNVGVWLAFLAVAAVTIIIPVALFSVTVYDNLLRFLGYGGGLPVVVTVVEDPKEAHSRTELNGFLMLRTNSALLLFEPEKARIREIPLQQVLFLDHNAVPLAKRVPRVP